MSLDFANLDQELFGWLFRLAKRSMSRGAPAGRVEFTELEPRLSILASAVAERRLRLVAVDGIGSVAADEIRLPRHLEVFGTREENAALFLLRTMLDAALVRLPVRAAAEMDEITCRLASLLLVPTLARDLSRELPGVGRALASLAPAMLRMLDDASGRRSSDDAIVSASRFAVDGSTNGDPTLDEDSRRRLLVGAPIGFAFGRAKALAHELGRSPSTAVILPLIAPFPRIETSIGSVGATVAAVPTQSTKEREAKIRDGVKRVVTKPIVDDNPLVHSFEKLHTAENYQGGEKSIDGDDELEDHGEALDELDLREVIRTDTVARSTYRSDLVVVDPATGPDATAADERSSIPYDEWTGDRYRKDYCRLFVARTHPLDPRAAPIAVRADRVERVRRVFEAIEDVRRLRPRQPNGSEIDVDAIVDRYAFVRAGVEGGDRLYANRRPVENDLATLILVDASSSSDGFLRGKHVLSVEREATAALGDALARVGSTFAVAGFFSQTHADCRFVVVKDFDDRWAARRSHLASLVPTGYTRIGAALRHGASMLGRVRAKKRALFLFTDGRPTDYDAYEGRYGIADVRMAFHECERDGILPFAFCVADRRSSQLRAMFGARGYESIADPDELPDRLFAAEARLRTRT